MALTTEYKGFSVEYSEYREVFACEELNLSDSKLSGLKAKIDTFDRDNRRLNREVLVVGWHDIKRGTATLIADDMYVWVTVNGKRGKEQFKSLADPTQSAKLEEWRKLADQAKAIGEQATAVLNSIPRLTKADLVSP